MSERLLPPLSEPRERLSRYSNPIQAVNFQRVEGSSAELNKDGIGLYNMGQATAFLLRAKEGTEISINEYMNLFHDNHVHNLGLTFFPAGEGTEVAGFVSNESAIQMLKSHNEYFDISFGLPSEESNSYIEYDAINNFSSIGCLAMTVAARGINERERGVWKLTRERQVGDRVGYKASVLTKHTELDINRSSKSYFDIPSDVNNVDYKWVDGYTVWPQETVQVVKIDINQFTKTLLGMSGAEQETFLLKTCGFFGTVERGLQTILQNDGKYSAFLGSRTADSVIRYLTKPEQIAAFEKIISQAQEQFGVFIKTVGKTVNDVTLSSMSDYEGKDMWNRRIFHSTKPVSEKEWRELELKAVEQQFPKDQVYFGNKSQK